MKATDILMEEHRAIERMLAVLVEAARRLDDGRPVDCGDVGNMIGFIRSFADGCHHQKEEGLLFPALGRVGFPRHAGPVGIMLHEHDLGRSLVKNMDDALSSYKGGDASAAHSLAHAARAFAGLLTEHIAKEDNVLFVMADQRLSNADQDALLAEFRRTEAEGGSCRRKEALLGTLEELEKRYLSRGE